MYHNQTIVIDYGNGQRITIPNQTVKVIEQSDVNYGYWNGFIVASFWSGNEPDSTWHGTRDHRYEN